MTLFAKTTKRRSFNPDSCGVRKDIGTQYFRSTWEANIARYFEWLKQKGEIDNWEYEPQTFWFLSIKRGVRSYKPDFRITEKGKVYYVEVKGYMDDRSRTRIKRFRKYYPQHPLHVYDKPVYKSIADKVGRLIPHWE